MKSLKIQMPVKGDEEATEYRYQRLTTRVLMDDFRFREAAPGAGDYLPEFELVTTSGERISTRDYADGQPLLLVFGSVTCPMTVGSVPSLKRLHSEFGDKVAFVTLYVREAHPGEHYPQPESLDEKLEHARALKELDEIPWMVATDDIDGTLHRALDTKPNAAYLVDADGKIAFRALWAGDERGLRQALESVARGNTPAKRQSRAMLVPLATGLGYVHEVLRRAGRQAQRDMLRAALPMAVAGLIATCFRMLSPNRRGVAALLTLGVLTGIVIGGVLWWLT